jgi:serine/threonine protein kinase
VGKNYGFAYEANGTLPYQSPEVLMGEKYNQKTDVWALGCILYELVTKRRAFELLNEAALRDKILSYSIPRLPTHSSSQ